MPVQPSVFSSTRDVRRKKFQGRADNGRLWSSQSARRPRNSAKVSGRSCSWFAQTCTVCRLRERPSSFGSDFKELSLALSAVKAVRLQRHFGNVTRQFALSVIVWQFSLDSVSGRRTRRLQSSTTRSSLVRLPNVMGIAASRFVARCKSSRRVRSPNLSGRLVSWLRRTFRDRSWTRSQMDSGSCERRFELRERHVSAVHVLPTL
mmetsp:Transcript_31938/g.110410  ORF Transcript_31938/g.110410 Transcript_31938/m.110410 type:complete len:205 (-) Transcript_31938:210-824(-)